MNSFGIEALMARQFEQCLKYITANLGGARLACHAKMIAPAGDFHV